MDTGDTGSITETGFVHYWGDECNHTSAAELAGETGGFSCSSSANSNFTLTLMMILFVAIKGVRR